jgi:hypothetical protein
MYAIEGCGDMPGKIVRFDARHNGENFQLPDDGTGGLPGMSPSGLDYPASMNRETAVKHSRLATELKYSQSHTTKRNAQQTIFMSNARRSRVTCHCHASGGALTPIQREASMPSKSDRKTWLTASFARSPSHHLADWKDHPSRCIDNCRLVSQCLAFQ